ncbi:MAG: IS1182 family transposase [Syntrophobacterales bacterium]|jgi:transposase|nr:IS1182 family transposase [Syntrophobacterales bacterium]
MARYKTYDYRQRVLLPVSLEDQLMPGTLEFAIHTLVEKRLDMSVFDGKYHNDETGRAAYDPKILLKVVLLAYSRGLISSRKIEQACWENVVFIALACGQQPDHSTIAAFVSSMRDEIQPLFRDVLLVCEEMNLLGGTMFALDGCKLPSNASKEWSGTFSELHKKKQKIEAKVAQLLAEQMQADQNEENPPEPKGSGKNLQQQVKKLQKKAALIEQWLAKNQPKIGAVGREKQSNVTDNDSATMMTSHGVVQGYNSQALIDAKHQVIVHGEASGDGQDHGHVPPMLTGALENLQRLGHEPDYFEGKIFTADSNYHTLVNLQKCQELGLDAYIPDCRFRNRDPRFTTQKRRQVRRFTLQDFHHDEALDQYICPNGKILKLVVKRVLNRGHLYRKYYASETDCQICPLRPRCIYGVGAKRKQLFVPINSLSHQMVEKIQTEEGRRIYPQRLAIVEPVFANIRINKRLDRFTLRGKIKVNIQWLMYCLVHNIEKILNYGMVYG